MTLAPWRLAPQHARTFVRVLLALVALTYAGFLAAVAAGWGRCLPTWQALSPDAGEACRVLIANNDVGGAGETLSFSSVGVLFVVLGAVLAVRRHNNRLGWIFLFGGLLYMGNAIVNVLAIHATEVGGTLPFATGYAVAAEVLGGPVIFAPFVLFFLLFPDGNVLSRRWRIAVWAVVVSAALQTLSLLLDPGPLRLAPLTQNPLGLAVLTGGLGDALEMTILLLAAALVASVVGLIIRFRRSRGVQRQQLKWFLTSGAFVGATLLLGPVFWTVPELEVLWGPLFLLATASVPVAATVAILRYRLYDLDVIVNRALVYGALTGLLAAVYIALVVVLQTILSGFGGSSDIAVAVSTLAVAALFRPVRRRVQAFIDRQFYRRRYNVLQTVEGFSAQLRQETDLARLRSDLLATVDATIQPSGAVLWIRGEAAAQ